MKAVSDGRLQYVSPSQINTHRRCPRSWYYTYVLGFRAPQTAAMSKGEAVHTQMEEWLADRSKLPAHPSAAKFVLSPESRLVPPPEECIIEHPKNKQLGLMVDDVKMVGRIDLIHMVPHFPSYRAVLDWKTTSNFKYAKKPEDLLTDPQMLTYAYFALQNFTFEGLALEHVYLLTDLDADPDFRVRSTSYLTPDEIDRSFRAFVVPDVYEIKSTCGESDVENTRADTGACFAFGGCPFRFGCSKFRERWGAPRGLDVFNGALTTAPLHSMLGLNPSEDSIMALDELFKMSESAPAEERINPPDRADAPVPDSPKTVGGLRLFIDCVPYKVSGEVQRLEDLIEERSAVICKATGVKDLREIKYAEGKNALVRSFREHKISGQIVARSGGMSNDVLEVLIAQADEVICG